MRERYHYIGNVNLAVATRNRWLAKGFRLHMFSISERRCISITQSVLAIPQKGISIAVPLKCAKLLLKYPMLDIYMVETSGFIIDESTFEQSIITMLDGISTNSWKPPVDIARVKTNHTI